MDNYSTCCSPYKYNNSPYWHPAIILSVDKSEFTHPRCKQMKVKKRYNGRGMMIEKGRDSEKVLNINQYKSRGLSLRVPVVGSTANPKDSKVTTPIKTLSIMSEIQTGLVFSLSRIFIQMSAPFTFISSSMEKTPMQVVLGVIAK
jgi:hypothetical protein